MTNHEKFLSQSFWNDRWENGETGWDIGYPSPAITDFMDQYPNKEAAILIPGCGNAYEAEYLAAHGFTNLTVLDIAPKAVERLKQKFEFTEQIQVLCGNFFEHSGSYDLVIEQTFFCAISPNLRPDYVQKMSSLLSPKGEIMGLLFNREFEKQGPPFGGSTAEYRKLFEEEFEILKMETCYNSIQPRMDSEVFIRLKKK